MDVVPLISMNLAVPPSAEKGVQNTCFGAISVNLRDIVSRACAFYVSTFIRLEFFCLIFRAVHISEATD
jgi:hypothetical protein